jgi:threonine/homoserine/homoserine lactone efflux protein
METEATFLISGVVLGLSAGLSPGPLLALVISETLRYGVKAGIKVAAAPLLTDAPIVAAALLILARLSDMRTVLGIVSIAGAAYLAYLAWGSLTFRGVDPGAGSARPRSLRKGVIANFLNPSPYIFWLSVGAPTVVRASGRSSAAAVFFVTGFYVLLVGSKVLLAVLAGRSRRVLLSRLYVWIVRLLGCALLFYGALFLEEGLSALGIV